jgi:polyribonucleotide nucleotidyltransferase
MVEGEAKEISEADMLEALKLAHETIKVQCQLQIELTEATGKTEKRTYNHEVKDENFKEELFKLLYDKVYAVALQQLTSKHQRSELFGQIVDEYLASLPEDTTVNKDLVKKYYKDIQKSACRNLVLNEKVRLDGRKTNEIRQIWSEVDYLPSAHGSSILPVAKHSR